MTRSLRSERTGAVLPVALILLVALTLLASGALMIARADWQASVAARSMARADVAARSAVLSSVSRLEADTSLPVGELFRGSDSDVQFGVSVQRPTAEWTILEGWGVGAPGLTPISRSRLVWRLDPLTRVGRFRAVIVAGGGVSMDLGASIDATDLLPEEHVGDGSPCQADHAALASLFPAGRLNPSEYGPALDSADARWLGLLGAADLADRLPALPAGPVPPGELVGFVSGDATLGAAGGGLLAVAGSLTLEVDADYGGLLLVRDRLALEPGARFAGLARVGAGAAIGAGASVLGRPCLALRALRMATSLSSTVASPSGPWLLPGG